MSARCVAGAAEAGRCHPWAGVPWADRWQNPAAAHGLGADTRSCGPELPRRMSAGTRIKPARSRPASLNRKCSSASGAETHHETSHFWGPMDRHEVIRAKCEPAGGHGLRTRGVGATTDPRTQSPPPSGGGWAQAAANQKTHIFPAGVLCCRENKPRSRRTPASAALAFASPPPRARDRGWGVRTRPDPRQQFSAHSNPLGTSPLLPWAAMVAG